MRIVASGLWRDDSDARYLTSAHDIDLNDREVSSEIHRSTRRWDQPSPTTSPRTCQAVAEVMDTNQATRDAGDVARASSTQCECHRSVDIQLEPRPEIAPTP